MRTLPIQIFLFIVLICQIIYAGENKKPGDIPWDTLYAEVLLIKQAVVQDSVRGHFLDSLFSRYAIQKEQFLEFQRKLFQKSIEEKISFFEKVEKILVEASRKREKESLKGDKKTGKSE